MTQRTVLLRGWPGRDDWVAPRSTSISKLRVWQRNTLAVYAAARLDPGGRPVMPERFGLGATLVCSGRSISRGCLIVADDLGGTDPAGLGRVRLWAVGHPLGPAPWQAWTVATLSEFFDPEATVESAPWSFTPNAYSGAGLVVGADLGRTFGVAGEHCSARRGRHRDSWEVWLPGWGREWPDGWRRRSPHRPALRLTARRVGWQVEFGPCEQGAGKYVEGRVWRGAFVDVMSLAYALDADRGASFAEHCENFGLGPMQLPLAVTVDETGAQQLADAVRAILALAVALDGAVGVDGA